MSINANTSVLEYERLTAERTRGRLARKAINRRRYYRRYFRIRGTGTPLGIQYGELVDVPVKVTINLHVYGPIGSDNLL